jgi:Rieske Fe-S protein
LRREDFVELKEVEIAGLERHLEVTPGETLVPIPQIEKDPSRRAFFIKLSNAIGVVLALPLVYPIFRYLTQPLYRPLDNSWTKIGNPNRISEINSPQQMKFQKEVREGYLTREFNKSHWVVKATPDLLEQIYGGKDKEYKDQKGKVIWVNQKETEFVVYAGKCPHLGCAYRWKKNKERFFCPCHLSIYELSGKVVSGPAPRPLDVLPTRVSPSGDIEIIDAEFKAGKTHMIRIV